MKHEVRKIPAAPRRVRLGALMARRWPLLVIGSLLTVFGGLVTWMLFLAAGAMPSDQRRLDLGPTESARAIVTRVEPPHPGPDGALYERVHYTFDYGGSNLGGSSIAAAARYPKSAEVEVELLPHEPNRNRIVGTVLLHHRSWLQPEGWLGVVVVPGALLLLGWLTGVFHLRHVLVHGDVSVGTVTAVTPVRWILPETLRVSYEFRDHQSRIRRGQHWVRVHSGLGMRLLKQQHTGWFEPMPVLCDRQFPQWNRMLLADDFFHSPVELDAMELPE